MVRPTRQLAIFLSLVLVPSHQLSRRMTALAFTAKSPTSSSFTISRRSDTIGIKKIRDGISYDISRLLFQAGLDEEEEEASEGSTTSSETISISDVEHINDSTYKAIINNPLGQPVLVDCYTNNCGPCKLIERSLQSVLPKYMSDNNLIFAKWDTDTKEHSERFMDLLREHKMTFRKLPTLILFVDGNPVAMRNGMASAGQVDRFLQDNLPVWKSTFVPTLRRRNAGGV